MNKYQRNVTDLDAIDVYDILNLYGVKSHAVGHAVKKLLMAGQRGVKDYAKDLQEAVQAIQREIDMQTTTEEEKRDEWIKEIVTNDIKKNGPIAKAMKAQQ